MTLKVVMIDMAKDLAIDFQTMDVKIPFQYVTGLDEIKQALIIRLMTPRGTYIRDDVGMDFNWIINGFNADEGRIAIEDTLTQDNRVTNVNYVDINKNGNIITINANVSTTLGIIDFEKGVDKNGINR